MKCKEAIELMSEAVERSAGIAFDCHLAGCASCSLYLSQVRLTIELTARLNDVSRPDADFHRRMLDFANGK